MSSFEDFSESAKMMGGADVDEEWLKELWEGADGDANRALNHLIDTPPEKYNFYSFSQSPDGHVVRQVSSQFFEMT